MARYRAQHQERGNILENKVDLLGSLCKKVGMVKLSLVGT
jgi:hypothetical protein